MRPPGRGTRGTARRRHAGPWTAHACGCGRPGVPRSGCRIRLASAPRPWCGDGYWWRRPASRGARGRRARRWWGGHTGQRRARLWKLFGRAATTFAPVGDASARSRRPWSKGSCPCGGRPPGPAPRRGCPASRRGGDAMLGPWPIGRARWSSSPASPCGGRGGGREQRALGPSQRRLCGPRGWSTGPGPPRRLPAGTCPPPTAGGGAPLPPPWPRGCPRLCRARRGPAPSAG